MMPSPSSGLPVVVGIDGSDAAINAALWAIDEAVARDAPLRLVAVVPESDRATPNQSAGPELQRAETALRTAEAAISTAGQPVKVETAIAYNTPTAALADESRSAAMLCVGSVGVGWITAKVLGSTAATVAHHAHCPVAIIRSAPPTASRPVTPQSRSGPIVLALTHAHDNDAVVGHGFAEAALRNAELIVLGLPAWVQEAEVCALLDSTLDRWTSRYPDVPVQTFLATGTITDFIAGNEEPVQLAVIGPADESRIVGLLGPGGASLFDHADCSVLMVPE
jgi:nucleotide-binding universal stress UspA family protein